MREILFRGKRTDNGEWVYGNLIVKSNDTETDYLYKIIPISMHDKSIGPFDFVDPETVGQYTGLTDKNGKRIFEEDIVDVEYDIGYVGVAAERIGLFEVVFDDGCFMKKNEKGLFHFIPSDKCEVIGNIHDNPELLKENE